VDFRRNDYSAEGQCGIRTYLHADVDKRAGLVRLGVEIADLFRLTWGCALFLLLFSALPFAVAVDASGPAVEFAAKVVADEYADSMYPSREYGSRLVLYVGNSMDRVQNVSGPARIYIQFDLSMIPRHASVLFAEMQLFQMFAPGSSQTYEVHLVESAWNETEMDWPTQPPTSPDVLAVTSVPTTKDVWVSWNVTSAVQAWVNGDIVNHGFMIRIQNEQVGVANQASGFYSREYPKEEVHPRIRVLCHSQPPFTFLISTHVVGLPSELSTQITSGNQTTTVHGEGTGYMLFEAGNTQIITASEYVSASNSVRYHAKIRSFSATNDTEFTVTYEPQFLVTVKSEPSGLIEREWSHWYDLGARVETPPAREVAEEGADMRLVLDGWYVNNAWQDGNPISFMVNGPAVLTARYTTMYNVIVTSPFGKTAGSGWYAAGSSVEISVTPTYVHADGVLGYLGLGMTFDHWSGSFEDTSPATAITVNGPIRAEALWREDRSRLLLGIAGAIAFVLIVVVALRRRTRSSSS